MRDSGNDSISNCLVHCLQSREYIVLNCRHRSFLWELIRLISIDHRSDLTKMGLSDNDFWLL